MSAVESGVRSPNGGGPRRRASKASGWDRRLASTAAALGSLIVGATASCGSGGQVAQKGPQSGIRVSIADGVVAGKTTGGTDDYLGIPYAAPPVGPLRWQPPRPAGSWSGGRDATRFAPHCPQPASYFGVASTSEDCLYLNVYTPAAERSNASKLPVMVWIHGGNFEWGESNDYDPSALVSHGVIVVTINYRLGALGFLADRALAGRPGGASGNYGLMDQQAALRWVQRNIRSFGGDARDVTVAGESAGGLSVLAQIASPGGRGLFARAIVESGAYDLNPESLAAAETSGSSFAGAAGCADQTLACLQALPVQTVLRSENQIGYRPDVDGQVLVRTLTDSFASGRFDRVPVIDGTNRDEYRLTVALYHLAGEPATAANYQALIATTLTVSATEAAKVVAKYPLAAYSSPSVALGAAGTDHTFACPALTADVSMSKYVPTYAYEFNDTNAPERYLPPVGFAYGAAHETELQYLFDLRNTANPGGLSAGQQQLAAAMQGYWTSFVDHGSPSSAAGALWLSFDNQDPQLLSLVPPQPTLETGFATEHHCGFWGSAG